MQNSQFYILITLNKLIPDQIMQVNESKSNSAQKELLTQAGKKEWVKPQIEIIGGDIIMGGGAPAYAEGVPTKYHFNSGLS